MIFTATVGKLAIGEYPEAFAVKGVILILGAGGLATMREVVFADVV